jgi:hypothetical protein
MRRSCFFFLVLCFAVTGSLLAQESPYFVTYNHHLADAGDLELGVSSTIGVPRSEQRAYFAPYSEFEYGVTRWWTSELYLESQSTSGDSSLFTGWRLENRFRPLTAEHAVNPVLYLEYENINEASRIEKEIVGKAPLDNQTNAELSQNHAHELEGKLILSSDLGKWNVAENLIAERNLTANEGFEFGYAFGVSRPLATRPSATPCRFCRKNLVGGIEFYGGLGSSFSFGLQETAHYAAPVLSWRVSDRSWVQFSAGVGLTRNSNPLLLRLGYRYEVEDFGKKVASLFR